MNLKKNCILFSLLYLHNFYDMFVNIIEIFNLRKLKLLTSFLFL